MDLITFCFTVLSFTGNWDTEKNRAESTLVFNRTTQREKIHLHSWASRKLLDCGSTMGFKETPGLWQAGERISIFPVGSDAKESCNAGDPSSIPELRRFLGEGSGYPLQYSCLENSINRGTWGAIVRGVAKSWT